MTDEEQAGAKGVRRPGQRLRCGWCGTAILVPARGRTPKWCSQSCRTAAWAARRAAASGDAEVRVVDRPVEVVREVQVVADPRSLDEWQAVLQQLTKRVDDGRVYDRDLQELASSVAALSEAVGGRIRRRNARKGSAYR